MEGMEDIDLEEQMPVQPPSSPAPPHGLSGKPTDDRRRVLVTPVRALSSVVLMVGVLFAVHLAVHDVRTFVLLVAEWLCIFFVMSCVAACERAPSHGGHGLGMVAEVAMWSFAMALTVTMTFWACTGLPLPAMAALYLLSLLILSTCFAVILGS